MSHHYFPYRTTNHTLKALNIPFKKVVLPGRVKCGGTEGEIVVADGCRKRKKIICGTEGEIVVAHGRLPSPARAPECLIFNSEECKIRKIEIGLVWSPISWSRWNPVELLVQMQI